MLNSSLSERDERKIIGDKKLIKETSDLELDAMIEFNGRYGRDNSQYRFSSGLSLFEIEEKRGLLNKPGGIFDENPSRRKLPLVGKIVLEWKN